MCSMHAPQPTTLFGPATNGSTLSSSSLMWGVMVSNTAPTRENGLLTYAQNRYAHLSTMTPCAADAVGKDVFTAPGDAWLWDHLPAQQRHKHFPVNFSRVDQQNMDLPQKIEGAENGVGALNSSELYAKLHLLLPLCSSGHGQVTIGRLTSNDIAFASNPCVSSVHCSLSYQPGSTREAECLRQDNENEGENYNQKRFKKDELQEGEGRQAHPGMARSKVHILLSDYSTNGCLINGQHVGKGKSARLHNADTVELINAGPRHTADYNLSFTFFPVAGFLEWVLQQNQHNPQQQERESKDKTAEDTNTKGKKADSDAARRRCQQRQRQFQTAARRRALLCKAQWNVEAHVRRMYGHRVDEFYSLDRARPLGEGTFGVVYRAALRSEPTNAEAAAVPWACGTTRLAQPLPLRTVASIILSKANIPSSCSGGGASSTHSGWEQQLFSTAAACVWTTNELDEAQLAEAYVREREQRAPTTVLRAAASVGSNTRTDDTAASAAAEPAHAFAVKIIRKQRMLLDMLQRAHGKESHDGVCNNNAGTVTRARDGTLSPTTNTAISTMPTAEAAVLQQLALLETQPDDLAERRREEWTAGALASLQLADTADELGSCIQDSTGKSEDILSPLSMLSPHDKDSDTRTGKEKASSGKGSINVVGAMSKRGAGTPPEQQKQREQRRHELLRCLPEPLRRSYEKELQHRRRQQCEINILLAVRHPNVTTLFEVFDQPDQLALVMEQATGGEVWNLLQPYQRRRRNRPAVKQPRTENVLTASFGGAVGGGSNSKALEADENEEEFAYDDVDLIGMGGPLPEYMVKLIIVQVLEAVLYLHTMGIIHRDLKLENLLLHRPCDRYALNKLQLQLLLQQLRNYEHSNLKGAQHASNFAAPSSSTSFTNPLHGSVSVEVEFSNPLSVLHTVHIPRALWPVVKVTDFGLSRVLDQLETRPFSSTSGTLHGYEASRRTPEVESSKEVPERVRLIYARNDATTSCGTPIYAAPEVTQPSLRPNKVGYSAAVDMYSVGVIAYALLTGRAPFPSKRHPKRPDGPPVVDYDAPLTFQRHRRRPATRERSSNSNNDAHLPPQQHRTPRSSCVDEPSARLPPLATVEAVRVPMPPEALSSKTSTTTTATTTGKESNAMAATAHAQRWRAHAVALAARVLRAQDEFADDNNSRRNSSARRSTNNKNSASHAKTIPSFSATVHQLTRALAKYAEGCARHGEEVDLDRLVYLSMEAALTPSAEVTATCTPTSTLAPVSSGRVLGADGLVSDVALPPISALGASFLRGLLEKYPLQRLTAYEALQHPWLRECVTTAEEVAEDSTSSAVEPREKEVWE